MAWFRSASRSSATLFNGYLALWRTQMLGPVIKTSMFFLVLPLSLLMVPLSFLYGCAGGLCAANLAAMKWQGWWYFANKWIREGLDDQILQKGMGDLAKRQLHMKPGKGEEPFDINAFRAIGALLAALLGAIYGFLGFMFVTVGLFVPGLLGGLRKFGQACSHGPIGMINGFFFFTVGMFVVYPLYVCLIALGGIYMGATEGAGACYVGSKVEPDASIPRKFLGFFGLLGIAKGMAQVHKAILQRGAAGKKIVQWLLG